MQVTQTLADGLKREFKVVVPAAEIASRADAQLEDMRGKVRVNGFRPGKVPVAHLRRLYGRSVVADVVNDYVGEANRKIVDENQIKLAMEPKLDFGAGDEGVAQVLEGKADLAWTVAVEVLPTFEVGDVSGIKIERPVVEVTVRKASGAASISASRVARGSNQVSRPAASSRRLAWRATSSAVP